MKVPLLLPALAALLLASCSSPVARRIEKNPNLFQPLSEHQKTLVRRGQIEEGMGKDAVWLAWGKADRVVTGSREGRAFERWSYTGYEPVQSTTLGFGLGGGYWGHGPYASSMVFHDRYLFAEPAVNYFPYEARRVEFTAGKVSAWSAGR